MKQLLLDVVQAAVEAGEAIMEVYKSDDLGVKHKEDNSPLTLADKASHNVLMEKLSALGDTEILSEEGKEVPWSTRQSWSRYWLIDPLDGTKEFIKRNGEFTVNVALVQEGVAVLGVVVAPAKDLLYFGSSDLGAFKCSISSGWMPETFEALIEKSVEIKVAPLPQQGSCWRVVGSRSHQSDEFAAFVKQFTETDIISMGSSLKLCLVAEGAADLYPRLGLTSEWDTAAAQAIVESAGGLVVNVETQQPLRYNHKESLLNPFFIVCASKSDQWRITATA